MIIPHNKLVFTQDVIDAVAEVMASGYIAKGKKVDLLEQKMAAMAGVKYAIATSSGSSALRVALYSLGVRKDPVIIPSYCCVAIPNAVSAHGALPVLSDIGADLNLQTDLVSPVVSLFLAKAVVVVNTFGVPAFIPQCGVPVIEDCSHCFGMESMGKKVGSRSEIGIMSLYATKLVGAGAGGMVFTNSYQYAQIARYLTGISTHMNRYSLGEQMSDIHAVIGLHRLQQLEETISLRRILASLYTENLLDCNQLQIVSNIKDRIWYRYVVRVSDAESVIIRLKDLEVCAEKPVAPWYGYSSSPFSEGGKAFQQILSLPLYPLLSVYDVKKVLNALKIAVCL